MHSLNTLALKKPSTWKYPYKTHLRNKGFYLLGLIHPPIAFPDVLCAGLWLRTPTDPELHDIEVRITAAVGTARENETLVEILEAGILDMAACHRNQAVELDRWRIRRGLSASCFGQGPPDETNEISRLKNKIQTEQKQLPEGYANILLIQSNSIFQHVSLEVLLSDLAEPIKQRGHLAAVIITGGNLGDASAVSVRSAAHTFERRIEEGRFDHTLLIWNPRARVRPSASLRASLLRAFFSKE
jgi:hypothetical protein